MSVLIACGYEVGGQPFRMADVLNRHGIPVWYLSLAAPGEGHDSTRFHHGERREPWDITDRVRSRGGTERSRVGALAAARRDLGIGSALATGAESVLLGRAGIPYRYWSFGSDLDQQSFAPVWPPGYPAALRPWAYCRFALGRRRRQRRALRDAVAVMIAPYQKPALDRICAGRPLFFLPHLLRTESREALAALRTAERRDLRARVGADRYVFSAVRHVWCGTLAAHSDNKGNDAALRAFAGYRELAGSADVRLVLVRKGPDAGASARLAGELGIAGAVVWIDEVPRDELARWYRGAALCLGQFGTPVMTYAMLEPLAQGTACLSHFTFPHPGVPGYADPPPGGVGTAPEEIAREMARLLGDEAAREEQAARSWRWVREHCSEERFVESFRALWAGEAG